MNQRPRLIEAAEAYGKSWTKKESYQFGLIEGRKQGIAMERSRVRKIEWAQLALLIFIITLAALLAAYWITK